MALGRSASLARYRICPGVNAWYVSTEAQVRDTPLRSIPDAGSAILVEETKRRFQLILQSQKLEWLFLIGKKVDQSIAFYSITLQPNKNALLMFTSPHAGNDYVRHNQLDMAFPIKGPIFASEEFRHRGFASANRRSRIVLT